MTAKLEINEWALDLATGGGRFNLVWTSTYTPTSRKGKQRAEVATKLKKANSQMKNEIPLHKGIIVHKVFV